MISSSNTLVRFFLLASIIATVIIDSSVRCEEYSNNNNKEGEKESLFETPSLYESIKSMISPENSDDSFDDYGNSRMPSFDKKNYDIDDIWRVLKTKNGFKLSNLNNGGFKRQLDSTLESELEFCSDCFFKHSRTAECMFCHQKYSFKTSKRVKPSSKYWYSRAGR